jgi:erythromycin esterase-like protein
MRKALKLAIILVFAGLLWGTASCRSQKGITNSLEDQSIAEWIANHAVHLDITEAGHGFDDMQPLKKIVGNARIVSLGEATHGTREFFQLKHRMVEFLATEMGFTIFSIEANLPEAYRLNDYILNGEGDPAKLLRGMYFWTWDTQEVLAMIHWMREFNQSGKGQIQFTGFDMQTPDVAMQIVRDFVAKNDPNYLSDFNKASQLAGTARQVSGSNFGVATGTFPVAQARGKRVRFSGYIKTENVTEGFAGLWWRVDGDSGILAFDNMQDRGVTGTADWKKYELELPVAADANNINFGALHPGNGTAWFDSLSIELDDVAYNDQSVFDLDFESPSPKGFFTSGDGYQVRLDSTVSYSGNQSLQMKYLDEGAKLSTTDPTVAAAAWKDVVGHLGAERMRYSRKNVTDHEIEWIIQNARVVLQCMQMRSNEVSRDRSMADNIKWILNQSPNQRMVVWAHNGHISKESLRGYEPMGAALQEMFGNQMVVFGFAFNRGSFQAIEMNKGLREFTVSAALSDSLDATLAASGIPILALDLRQIPKTGPVAEWWNQTHKTRSIGAVFSEDAEENYWSETKAPDCYDAILFVDNTTAARKNPGR